jgi:hypothetical protein
MKRFHHMADYTTSIPDCKGETVHNAQKHFASNGHPREKEKSVIVKNNK